MTWLSGWPVNVLIKDIERNGNEGLGKPEALRS